MPLTDFLKNFLTKLPENIQYLGTDVAPLMGPNWQQAIQSEQQRQMQLNAAQQQQENWEKQFGAQQQQQGTQNQLQQGQLLMQALEHGFMPQGVAQPQRTPGGPGLNGGGANPSFGAGGGAGAAPSQALGPDPSNMSSIAPFAAMFGMQQGGGQGVNQPNNVPSGPMSPSSRMPSMSGDSGGGGAIAPAGIDIPGLPGRPMLPPPPVRTQSLPDPVADFFKMPHGITLPAQQFASMMDTFARVQSKASSPTNEKPTEKEVLIQSQLAGLGATDDWKTVAKTNPSLYAKAVSQAEEIINPGMAAQRRDADQALADKLKLNQAQKDNAISFWDRTKADPSTWFDKEENKDTRIYAEQLAKQRGEENFIPKKPLDNIRQQSEAFALDVLNGNQQLRNIAGRLMQVDPGAFGAMTGRWNEGMTKLGAVVGNSPESNYLINRFLDTINPILARDTKQLSGGRAAIQMMNMLKQSFPTLHTNPGALAASFDTADNIAKSTIRDNRLFSYGITDPKKFYPGEEISHKSGQVYHFKNYTPDGKIQTMEEGQ
jgi:hypothetical protein